MPVVNPDKPFLLQINSLDDLERFFNIVRNEKLNHQQVNELTAKLKESSDSLKTAVDNEGG